MPISKAMLLTVMLLMRVGACSLINIYFLQQYFNNTSTAFSIKITMQGYSLLKVNFIYVRFPAAISTRK